MRKTLPILLLAACTVTHAYRGGSEAGPPKAEGIVSDGHVQDFDVEVAQAASLAHRVVLAYPEEKSERLMVRRGALTLRTANPEEVGKRAQALVGEAGGWVAHLSNNTFVFRVPAPRFDEVFSAIEKMGAVGHKEIDAEDVTEQVRDLDLRLKNARALRDRYAALLEKANEVKDVLAIEKELAKITEEIERLEAQLRNKRRDVAYSRLTLTLQPVQPAADRAATSPFPWLARIGVDQVPAYRADRAYRSRLRWELPGGFADMGRTKDRDLQGWAYAPEGIRIVVRRFDHKPQVDASFWNKELRRELVSVRGYEAQKGAAGVLRFASMVNARPTSYAIRLIVGDHYLTVVEVVGPTEVVDARWSDIDRVLAQVADRAR